MAEDAKVLVDAFELLKEALPAIGRFPRTFRFTLGKRIETRLYDVVELLHEARFGRRCVEALEDANIRLQNAGAFLRLGCDLRLVSLGLYGQLGERITLVGRQIGGWRKHAQGKGDGI